MFNQSLVKGFSTVSSKLYGLSHKSPFRRCRISIKHSNNCLPMGLSSVESICYLNIERRGFSSTKDFEFIVTKNSWAADRLTAAGENLPEDAVTACTELTKEILFQPTEKVNFVVNNILSLNFLEMNQLVRAIQVINIYCSYDK